MKAKNGGHSNMAQSYKVALVGASGAVGREVLNTLEQRRFPISKIHLFSSAKSAGRKIIFQNAEYALEELRESTSFVGFDFVFFMAGKSVSEKYAPKAAVAGAWVIDNSSFFRMHADVPLVIPEINGHLLREAAKSNYKLIANPNCNAAPIAMVLKPLLDAYGLESVSISSYQAVSGKGQAGIDEFQNQQRAYANGTPLPKPSAFPHAIAFNCIPQVDQFLENGFTGEEEKVIAETKKILSQSTLRVMATCVRVPVLNAHSESVLIETSRIIPSLAEAKSKIAQMPGVVCMDAETPSLYPVASMVSGKDEVFVGRVRWNLALPDSKKGLSLWIVSDNLRKGAALNAVQIAEATF